MSELKHTGWVQKDEKHACCSRCWPGPLAQALSLHKAHALIWLDSAIQLMLVNWPFTATLSADHLLT